jgi:hypothetical protein
MVFDLIYSISFYNSETLIQPSSALFSFEFFIRFFTLKRVVNGNCSFEFDCKRLHYLQLVCPYSTLEILSMLFTKRLNF